MLLLFCFLVCFLFVLFFFFLFLFFLLSLLIGPTQERFEGLHPGAQIDGYRVLRVVHHQHHSEGYHQHQKEKHADDPHKVPSLLVGVRLLLLLLLVVVVVSLRVRTVSVRAPALASIRGFVVALLFGVVVAVGCVATAVVGGGGGLMMRVNDLCGGVGGVIDVDALGGALPSAVLLCLSPVVVVVRDLQWGRTNFCDRCRGRRGGSRRRRRRRT